ncbi:hypothetical protein ACTQ49_11115 [Luteococcus sp. Sow4_B9]|uniref:hypothetical protein n=1 Tax=Luteococcus sp. Sow4_B9 TaxID=3438792 RepID=UPI003F9C7114
MVRRRTVLKGVTLSAVALGTGALNLAGASRAAAETSPTGLTGFDANDCKDAYPNGYPEDKDNVGIYVNEPGACFGGTFIGSVFCDASGWYRTGTDSYRQTYRPISTTCGTTNMKNAWRWTVNGVTYRCSDGRVTIPSYWYYSRTYLAICRAKV